MRKARPQEHEGEARGKLRAPVLGESLLALVVGLVDEQLDLRVDRLLRLLRGGRGRAKAARLGRLPGDGREIVFSIAPLRHHAPRNVAHLKACERRLGEGACESHRQGAGRRTRRASDGLRARRRGGATRRALSAHLLQVVGRAGGDLVLAVDDLLRDRAAERDGDRALEEAAGVEARLHPVLVWQEERETARAVGARHDRHLACRAEGRGGVGGGGELAGRALRRARARSREPPPASRAQNEKKNVNKKRNAESVPTRSWPGVSAPMTAWPASW